MLDSSIPRHGPINLNFKIWSIIRLTSAQLKLRVQSKLLFENFISGKWQSKFLVIQVFRPGPGCCLIRRTVRRHTFQQNFKSKIIVVITICFEFESYFIVVHRIPWTWTTNTATIFTVITTIHPIKYDIIGTAFRFEFNSSPVSIHVIGAFEVCPTLLIVFISVVEIWQCFFFRSYLSNEFVIIVITTFDDLIITQLF